MIKYLKNIFSNKTEEELYKKISYSQLGEDLIIEFVFNGIGINKIKYLDIGAYHPIEINNTYLFYLKGSQGVLIEADPYLVDDLEKMRPNDIILNVGIGPENRTNADFYIMSARGLNTFDDVSANKINNEGDYHIRETVKVNIKKINDIIDNYFNQSPNLINIDSEGLDFQILQSFNFDKYRPEIFCVETVEFGERGMQEKFEYIHQFMAEKGYFVFADTFVNTIYVEKDKWKNRKVPWLDHN